MADPLKTTPSDQSTTAELIEESSSDGVRGIEIDETSLEPAMVGEPRQESELFKRYFGQLNGHEIPYVILHAYNEFPKHFSGDVDYAIAHSSTDDVVSLLGELGKWGSWRRVQCLRHEATASYDVFMHREIPGCNLKLDFCSHYLRNGALLLPNNLLLEKRRRRGEFFIPAADVEFAYVLAKGLAKRKDLNTLKPILQRLLTENEPECRERAKQLIGDDGEAHLFTFLASGEYELDLPSLRRSLLRKHKSGFRFKLAEFRRIVRRLNSPTGFSVAVLGPDGIGKSTLIEGLQGAMRPAFRRIDKLHFRPNTFEPKGDEGPHINPHGAKPRPAPLAFAKILYYYLDHLLGYLTIVWPLKCRSSLVVFDRCFDDIIVDPKRFRIGGFTKVSRWLRGLLPKHDLVLVLDAPPEVVSERKQELSLDELRRQREAFAGFADSEPNYVLIDASDEPQAVLASCYRAVVDKMAKRLSE